MSCDHDCDKPPVFPKPIDNRPGLPTIDYRIGAYAELRDYMFDVLNKEPALFNWTHRGSDDPGIALIESAAIVGDILTFYQNLYANEVYLRTAKWRESISELVRLLGYRLAPSLAGAVTFALAVKGKTAITVPKAFGFKAQLEGQSKPAEFESLEETIAYPHLSQFNLYRSLQTPGPNIGIGTNEFSLSMPDGAIPDLELEEGDRLLVGVAEPDANNPKRLVNVEKLIVKETRREFGRLIVKVKGAIVKNSSVQSLMAFKLGDSHRHFGHNAPAKTIGLDTSVNPAKLTSTSVSYFRSFLAEAYRGVFGDDTYYETEPDTIYSDIPLDSEVDTIGAGNTVLISMAMQGSHLAGPVGPLLRATLIAKVTSAENKSMALGNLSGSGTVLTLEENPLILAGKDPVSTVLQGSIDIRGMTVYETQGEMMVLRAAPSYISGTTGKQLDFFGTADEAEVIKDRSLMLAYNDGTVFTVAVTGFPPGSLDDPEKERERSILIDTDVDYTKFHYEDPQVIVYGNLVPTTQGKTEDEVVLGGGDQRQIFQTFPLPKTPLTYLLDETQTPAQVPELTIYIDNIEWRRVDTFFNSGPEDKVYVVREDTEGKSYVQFGDGITGSRLTSGKKNVVAIFRTGSEGYGPLKAKTQPQGKGRLTDLDKIFMPSPVTGGAAREDENNARKAAPGKIQSLGRLVSLADFEAETMALPNVLKAKAGWAIPEGVPLVRLVVLTQSGEEADTIEIRDTMNTYNQCRGPSRFPIQVMRGIRQFVFVEADIGIDPSYREENISIAVKQALGMIGEEGNGIETEDGLFGLNRRQFGQGVHNSQIIGAIQQVSGVVWVKLKSAQNINLGIPEETDPLQLAVPASPVLSPVLTCTDDKILVLHTKHLSLVFSKVEATEPCS